MKCVAIVHRFALTIVRRRLPVDAVGGPALDQEHAAMSDPASKVQWARSSIPPASTLTATLPSPQVCRVGAQAPRRHQAFKLCGAIHRSCATYGFQPLFDIAKSVLPPAHTALPFLAGTVQSPAFLPPFLTDTTPLLLDAALRLGRQFQGRARCRRL